MIMTKTLSQQIMDIYWIKPVYQFNITQKLAVPPRILFPLSYAPFSIPTELGKQNLFLNLYISQ